MNVDLVRRGYAKVLGPDRLDHKKALEEVPPYSRLVSKLLMSEKVRPQLIWSFVTKVSEKV